MPDSEKPEKRPSVAVNNLRLPLETLAEDAETHFQSSTSRTRHTIHDDGHAGVPLSPAAGLDEEEEPTNRRQRWLGRLRLVLPHVGLVAMSLLYTMLGATLFYFIEHPNEVNRKEIGLRSIHDRKAEISDELWRLAQVSGVEEDRWKASADQSLNKLVLTLFEAYDAHNVRPKDFESNTTESMWTFSSAMFFSATLITTIGYGHLVPHTQLGKVMCILFGVFGIPLILVTTADMGKFLSEYVTSVYQRCEGSSAWMRQRTSEFLLRKFRMPPMLLHLMQRKDDAASVDTEGTAAGGFDIDKEEPSVL